VVNDLLTRVRDIYQRLLSKLLAPLSMPEQPPPNVKAKRKVNSSLLSQKALLRKRAVTAKRAKDKK